MEYDFSNLCAEQLEKIEKRLTSLKKSFIKQYEIGMDIIQHESPSEATIQANDIMSDYINRTSALWTEALNKVKAVL